jgi:hypothetical protein
MEWKYATGEGGYRCVPKDENGTGCSVVVATNKTIEYVGATGPITIPMDRNLRTLRRASILDLAQSRCLCCHRLLQSRLHRVSMLIKLFCGAIENQEPRPDTFIYNSFLVIKLEMTYPRRKFVTHPRKCKARDINSYCGKGCTGPSCHSRTSPPTSTSLCSSKLLGQREDNQMIQHASH